MVALVHRLPALVAISRGSVTLFSVLQCLPGLAEMGAAVGCRLFGKRCSPSAGRTFPLVLTLLFPTAYDPASHILADPVTVVSWGVR